MTAKAAVPLTIAWRLYAAGSPRMQSATGGAASVPLSRKDAALLTYVALVGITSSVRVALLLWPGDDPRRALNSLRQRLHRLRRATGARLLEVADTATLAADLSVAVPIGGDAAMADPIAGDLLGGYDYADAPDFAAWLEAERKLWAAARREALADAASVAERLGELARALVCAQQLLADDALSEHAHRRVMRLHYLRGDSASAVAAFDACEQVLKDELGLKPSAETLALLQTVERGQVAHPAAGAPMPASLLRPPRAVGRGREQALLVQAQHDGNIAVLVGEAGMGKTRLLQDFIATEPQAVYVQARPGDASVPYGALARLLRAVVAARPALLNAALRPELARVAPELGEGAASARPTPRLQPAIEELMVAALAHGSHTLVVDDLHFADRASIEMLRALVDAEALAGLRWVFAHRPVAAADEDGALLQSLADAPRARWITLAPLTDADLAELLGTLALPGIDAATLAPALARHTGGNPLYVLETLREARRGSRAGAGWSLPQPQSIAHMIDRRLQRLSERALALGRVAALAGPDFSPELAEHALATPALLLAGAWAELEAADVLRGNAFAHDLVRDGMLRATPQAIAVHAHRLLARYLETIGGEPARVARHWQDGGNALKAGEAWWAAADRARAALRVGEELELLALAALSFEHADARLRLIQTLARLGPLQVTAGSVSAARANAARALAAAQTDAERVHGLILSMEMHAVAREFAASLNVAQRLIDCAARCGDDVAELRGWRGLAAAHAYEGRVSQALEVHESRSSWIEAQPVREDLLEWSVDHAYMLDRLGRQDEAVALYARVGQRASAHGHGRIAYEAITNEVMSTYRLGLTHEALELAGRVRQLADGDADVPQVDPIHLAVLGAMYRDVGRFADAIEVLDKAIASARSQRADGWLPGMVSALALAYAQLGQQHRVERLFAQIDQTADATSRAYFAVQRAEAARYDTGGLTSALCERRLALLEALEGNLPDRYRMLVTLQLSALRDHADRGAYAQQALILAQRQGGHGFVLHARLRALDAFIVEGGTRAKIESEAEAIATQLNSRDAHGMYRPEAWLICARAFEPSSERAAQLRHMALRWVETIADRCVPVPLCDSFRHRNSFNIDALARHFEAGVA